FKLLNYGFKNFSTVKMFNENEVMEKVSVWKGKSNHVYLITDKPGIVTIPLREEQVPSLIKKIPKRIFAPIERGEKIGELKITMKGKSLKEVALVAQDEVPSGNFAKLLIHTTLLSFILPPYGGWIIVLILLLFAVAVSAIRRKAR
ncbi:MAG: hypothetical protein JRC57_01290, partial [Deltaproteobacteria bacterium]|nr:hypothetical protein [Deltaproteobacteria bacterium]